MKSGILSAVTLAMLVISTAALPCRADKADKEARKQFKEGIRLYEKHKFEEAAIAFERAYELKPSYKILFNIAQVEAELEHYAAAYTAYSQYLEQGKDEIGKKRREHVRSELERLSTLVGFIQVTCPVDGAKIKVNNEAQGTTPLSEPILIDIGKHEVVVIDGADELFSEIIKVAGGETVSVEVEIKEEEPPPELPAPVTAPTEEKKPKRLWTWVALAVGGAAGIGAGITGGVAASKKSDLDDNCDSGTCPQDQWGTLDSSRNLATTTNVLIGVAAVGVASGAVLFFVEPKLNGTAEESIAVVPTVSPDGAGVALGGRF